MWTVAVRAIAYTSLLGVAAGVTCDEFTGCPAYLESPEEIDDCIPEGDRRLQAGKASHALTQRKPRRLHPHPAGYEEHEHEEPEHNHYAYVPNPEMVVGNTVDVCCEEYRWKAHCGLHCWASTLRETTDEISFTEVVGVPTRMPGAGAIDPEPESLLDAAKEECIQKGSKCWGVMDMGCGGENIYLCNADTKVADLAESPGGTCVLQKVDIYYNDQAVAHAAPRRLGSYGLMLLTLSALGISVSHA